MINQFLNDFHNAGPSMWLCIWSSKILHNNDLGFLTGNAVKPWLLICAVMPFLEERISLVISGQVDGAQWLDHFSGVFKVFRKAE